MIDVPEHLNRDFVGYGGAWPDPKWPGNARLALNICINYEEGSEPAIPDGDAASETGLTEGGSGGFEGRDLAAESMFEYGSRVGLSSKKAAFCTIPTLIMTSFPIGYGSADGITW